MLMAGNGLVEAFTIGKAAEVEGGSPTVFVDVGCEVVVAGLLSMDWFISAHSKYLTVVSK